MVLFGIGITAAMSLYGLVASGLIRGVGRVGPAVAVAVGIFCVVIGIHQLVVV